MVPVPPQLKYNVFLSYVLSTYFMRNANNVYFLCSVIVFPSLSEHLFNLVC